MTFAAVWFKWSLLISVVGHALCMAIGQTADLAAVAPNAVTKIYSETLVLSKGKTWQRTVAWPSSSGWNQGWRLFFVPLHVTGPNTECCV